jgi:hypothetical protein
LKKDGGNMAAAKKRNNTRGAALVNHDRSAKDQPIARKRNRMNSQVVAIRKDTVSENENEGGEMTAMQMLLSLSEKQQKKSNDKDKEKSIGNNKDGGINTITEECEKEREDKDEEGQNTPEMNKEPMIPIDGMNDDYESEEEENTGSGTNLLFGTKEEEVPIAIGTLEVQNMLAKKRKELEEKRSCNVSAKLDDIEAMSLQGEWASKTFHIYKYVTEAMLEEEGDGSIMKDAFDRMRISGSDKKTQKRKAIKSFILQRVGNMRDYFVQRVKKSIIEYTREYNTDVNNLSISMLSNTVSLFLTIIAAEHIKSAHGLLSDLQTLLTHRGTMDVKEESDDMKRLWVWYGFTLMPTVMRRGWEWNSVVNRKNCLFRDCVLIGDEALVLQIVEIRIKDYWLDKESKKEGEATGIKRKRGRTEGAMNKDTSLKDRICIFMGYRDVVGKIRKAEKDGFQNDKFGWNKYLQNAARVIESASGAGRSKSSANDFRHLMIPGDDIEQV